MKTRRALRARCKRRFSRCWPSCCPHFQRRRKMFDDTIENKAANDAANAARAENIGPAAPVREVQAPKEHPSHTTAYDFRAVAIAITGWILPGFGHALLRMWGRAVTVFLAVGFLVYLGAGMRGNLF